MESESNGLCSGVQELKFVALNAQKVAKLVETVSPQSFLGCKGL
jgi:hypothetical protein